MTRYCFLFLVLAWSASVCVAQPKAPEPKTVAPFIVTDTNAFRKKHDRSALVPEGKLTEAALAFARFMADTGKYGHNADGRQPDERARRQGYDPCIVAENIAYIFDPRISKAGDLARTMVQGWENSPGHRKNMLNPDITQIGVGVARSEKSGYYYAVQMFGRPKSESISFQLINETKVPIKYSLGDRSLSLPADTTHTHQPCGVVALTFDWPNGQRSARRQSANGKRYIVTRDVTGKYQLTDK